MSRLRRHADDSQGRRANCESRSVPKEAALAVVEDIPTKRFQQPSEIAQAVAFLASTGARSITGQLLVVDGGQSVAI